MWKDLCFLSSWRTLSDAEEVCIVEHLQFIRLIYGQKLAAQMQHSQKVLHLNNKQGPGCGLLSESKNQRIFVN